MTFIYRDPFTAHEVAPELSADEQAVVERFGIHAPSTEHHKKWCVGRTGRSNCACDDPCCSNHRHNGHVQCICPKCDGTCGAHIDNGGALAIFLFCVVAAFIIGCAILRGAM